MPRLDLDNPKPTRFQKLQVITSGHIWVGKYIKPEWKAPRDFYLFLCKKHGYVTSPVKGYNERLECPKCWEDAHGA